mmetsp:Transcript_7076/g.14866  ORF Transcript_7076/g.14866 Transcript_7076/m.14866 type:complete len:323 (-) Transcript_7076:332-1300(-)
MIWIFFFFFFTCSHALACLFLDGEAIDVQDLAAVADQRVCHVGVGEHRDEEELFDDLLLVQARVVVLNHAVANVGRHEENRHDASSPRVVLFAAHVGDNEEHDELGKGEAERPDDQPRVQLHDVLLGQPEPRIRQGVECQEGERFRESSHKGNFQMLGSVLALVHSNSVSDDRDEGPNGKTQHKDRVVLEAGHDGLCVPDPWALDCGQDFQRGEDQDSLRWAVDGRQVELVAVVLLPARHVESTRAGDPKQKRLPSTTQLEDGREGESTDGDDQGVDAVVEDEPEGGARARAPRLLPVQVIHRLVCQADHGLEVADPRWDVS